MKLRPLEDKDICYILEWMHDPVINKVFKADFSAYDENKVKVFIDGALSEVNRHYACVNDQDEYLGTVSLKNINYIEKNAEYAVSFRKSAQGTGASLFATKEILKIAFYELGLYRVYLNVIGSNQRANAFYKKAGFIYEGSFRRHIKINGVLEDLNWYGILKEEFEKGEKDYEKNTICNI